MEITANQVGWGIWLLRAGLTWAGSAGLAFLVADYVVKARTASLDTAIATINTTLGTSFENLNSTLNGIQTTTLDTNRKVDQLAEKLGDLSTVTAVNSERILRLEADLQTAQASISKTSVEIKSALKAYPEELGPAIAASFGKSLVRDRSWTYDVLKANDATNQNGSHGPIFLTIPPHATDRMK
ncbi:hypothetical protein FGK63_14300 [Ruegeria sediminis]|uniref:Uncharacterized protein n=1 Tax=Ruegeria sediminis TaxID=2583820 RepID=A0ABY2WUP1_9RHOB|nr:hypothetical protein [Ruegeria sediminis]TMV06326.1 hypothetical protein FGK63_14300 [Ruegeria sediminis]